MAKVYKGKCFCCGNEYAKRGMTRHLKSCVNSPRMGVCGYTGPAEENKDLRKW
ncbi:MAG: hypothetical protein PWR10_1708 [Halanaerobiales bacterium]|nr:hypothetical protein [Halanaerobiales bacterium]